MDDRIHTVNDPAPPDGRWSIDRYETPVVIDYGTLQELTLSGSMPLSDTWGGAAGGGS